MAKMSFAPGLSSLQCYLSEKNPTEHDPFIARGYGQPQWMGGFEALDGVFVYINPENDETDEPSYFHFVTIGLSDLYGDGRVRFPTFAGCSGFGIELTIKVRKLSNSRDEPIPCWPINILQFLARYVFETGTRICAGDDIPLTDPIMPGSRLNNLLTRKDEKYSTYNSPNGTIDFVQIVPVTQEEFDAAHNWKATEIINLMEEIDPNLMITDVSRDESIFELAPEIEILVKEETNSKGSDVGSYSVYCAWDVIDQRNHESGEVLELYRLKLSPKAAVTLQRAISSRFRHGRHLTLKSPDELHAITFFPTECPISTLDKDEFFRMDDSHLQVRLSTELIEELNNTLPTSTTSRIEYEFVEHELVIEIDDFATTNTNNPAPSQIGELCQQVKQM